MRLFTIACLIGLSSAPGVASQEKEVSSLEEDSVGGWVVHEHLDSQMTERSVTLGLKAEIGKNSYGVSPTLIVECVGGESRIFIEWGEFLGETGRFVTVSLDRDAGETVTWNLSEDGTATVYPEDGHELLTKLTGHSRMAATVSPSSRKPIVAVFHLAGAGEAVESNRILCGLSRAASRDPRSQPSEAAPRYEHTPYTVKPRCISGCTVEAILKSMPSDGLRRGVKCHGTIAIRIDTHGRVTATDILKSSGNTVCDEAWRTWARSTTWTRALNDGVPVVVWIAQPLSIETQ